MPSGDVMIGSAATPHQGGLLTGAAARRGGGQQDAGAAGPAASRRGPRHCGTSVNQRTANIGHVLCYAVWTPCYKDTADTALCTFRA